MESYISVKVTGSNRVQLVKNLRAFADNLDGSPAAKNGKVVNDDEDVLSADTENGEAESFEDEVASTKTRRSAKKGKKAAAVEEDDAETEESEEDSDDEETMGVSEDSDDESEETEEEEDEAPEEETSKKKSAKSKIDAKAVNEACKQHARKFGFEKTKALLQKKFKTSSVSALKPEQFTAVMQAVALK